MSVSVNDILDASLVTNGKFPDVYWDMGLTGSEIRIVRYVFNNCLRLYNTIRVFPRGSDGSPRFWRGKERMAEDCGVSYPTFRKSIRRLSRLGLVTPMDSEGDTDGLYCIGLSAGFIESLGLQETEKSFRSHNLYSLISLIYDELTVGIVINNLDNLPSSLLRKDELHVVQESHDEVTPKTQPTKRVRRKAIIVGRVPITRVPKVMLLQSAKEQLKLLEHVRTPRESKVLEVVEYYEYKCRQAINSSGFRALGKDFRNHKNWRFFVRLYELCEENGWDYRVYIDAQFDRVRYWKRKQRYPYANQFTSEGAVRYYHGYVRDYKEKNSLSGNARVKTSKVKSVKQEIISDVIKDCESISAYIGKAGRRRANKGLTGEQLKMLYLSDHWMGLSAYYLASIPWFGAYLDQLPEETFITELKESIGQLRGSRRMSELISSIVSKVEGQMGIPGTICL